MKDAEQEDGVSYPLSPVDQVRDRLDVELRSGRRAPGSTISVKEIGDGMKISGTPVREGLERLVGEGRIVATGCRHGFAVPRFGNRALGGLYSFAALLVEAAFRDGLRAGAEPAASFDLEEMPPPMLVDHVMAQVTNRSGNPFIVVEASRIACILAPYRLAETIVLPEWRRELEDIARAMVQPASGIRAVRRYTRVRKAITAELIDAAEGMHG